MDQDRQLPPRASNRSCVAHRRADHPEKGLRSSQHVPARTTDVSASSPHEATQPIMRAFLQSTPPASTMFESWLPMDADIFRKGNCNAKAGCSRRAIPREPILPEIGSQLKPSDTRFDLRVPGLLLLPLLGLTCSRRS